MRKRPGREVERMRGEKMPIMRLDRYLSGQGACRRSEVREAAKQGRITVNGVRASASMKINTGADQVVLDGKPVVFRPHVYYMMNKPAGVLSATDNPKDEGVTAVSLLPEEFRRPGLFPAGRLDKDAEGFLLITDDGDFAHRVLAPGKHVAKKYFVRLSGPAEAGYAEKFAAGIVLEDGTECLSAGYEPAGENEAVVTLFEGKFHQVKRMFAAVGNRVVYLKRISFGGLILDKFLKPGQSREMSHLEIAKIEQKA